MDDSALRWARAAGTVLIFSIWTVYPFVSQIDIASLAYADDIRYYLCILHEGLSCSLKTSGDGRLARSLYYLVMNLIMPNEMFLSAGLSLEQLVKIRYLISTLVLFTCLYGSFVYVLLVAKFTDAQIFLSMALACAMPHIKGVIALGGPDAINSCVIFLVISLVYRFNLLACSVACILSIFSKETLLIDLSIICVVLYFTKNHLTLRWTFIVLLVGVLSAILSRIFFKIYLDIPYGASYTFVKTGGFSFAFYYYESIKLFILAPFALFFYFLGSLKGLDVVIFKISGLVFAVYSLIALTVNPLTSMGLVRNTNAYVLILTAFALRQFLTARVVRANE
jgi:hypothetical protein